MRTFKTDGPEPPIDVLHLVTKDGWTLDRAEDGLWIWSDETGACHESGPIPWEMVSVGHGSETLTEVMFDAYKAEMRLKALMWEPEMGPPPKSVGMLQLLEQDVWWIPRDSEPIRLVDMEDSHKANLLAFLKRRAVALKMRYELQMITGPRPDGDMACDQEWLEEKPLYKALAQEVSA